MKMLAIALFMVSVGYAGVAWGGLIWQEEITVKAGFGDSEIVTTAQFYCDNLKFDDFVGWRLPTANELIQFARLNHIIRPLGLYWSSTPIVSKRLEAWAVDVGTGVAQIESQSALHWVMCVRND